MITIELKTPRDIKNMVNALHREKSSLAAQILHYENQGKETIYIKKLIESHRKDVKIIEVWEEKIGNGLN